MNDDRATGLSTFTAFVSARRDAVRGGGTDEATRYAFGADLQMLRTMRRMKPLEMFVGSAVRAMGTFLASQNLGTMVRVGPTQSPRLYRIAKECADALGVAVPTLYVANSPVMNAYTYGTDDDSFIVVHAKLVDHFTDDELKFVIGHEMGHIQNRHVVYLTAMRLLTSGFAQLIRFLIEPVLLTWSRRAEITCDRAGLLCCGDIDVATRTFLKMACGSTKLYDELNIDAYLEQLEAGRESAGRFSELFASHPYLPKRIRSLQLFAQSDLYRTSLGLSGGLSMDEVDQRTLEIVQVLKGGKTGEASLPSGE
ncbi:MAG: M48 family metallopeptidase [Sandaracinus sp.]|nr:M48 family metallopeptidase [Sandaracinus sp.]